MSWNFLATVRLRQRVTKGPGSRAAGVAMAFKLIESAQTRWRAVNAPLVKPTAKATGEAIRKGLERLVRALSERLEDLGAFYVVVLKDVATGESVRYWVPNGVDHHRAWNAMLDDFDGTRRDGSERHWHHNQRRWISMREERPEAHSDQP